MNKKKEIKAGQFGNQPVWFKGLNTAWKSSYSLGTKSSLEKDSLIQAARKSTKLNDFGSSYWEEPLDRLLESINHEAELHPIGQFITRQRLIQLLSVRLRAEHWFKKQPEILEQELYPIWLIIGLQRTGTTKLQRLLASDPENRALLSWEGLNPAPLNGDLKTGSERIKIARTSEKALKLMSPAFFAIHPVEHLAPEEDVLLLDVSFLSTTTEATMHVPTYASWLEKQDQGEAYKYMAKLLKLLQWQRPGKRWVLKTPHHLEFLPETSEYFGDVRYIWTHREVYESIPSFLSMVSYARQLFSDRVDPQSVADHWLKKTSYMLKSAMEFHNTSGIKNHFIHTPYQQLVENPMGVLEQIYSNRDLEVSDSLNSIFTEANKNNPKGKYGNHQYALSDFNLKEEDIEREVRDYRLFFQKMLTDQLP